MRVTLPFIKLVEIDGVEETTGEKVVAGAEEQLDEGEVLLTG